MRDAILRSSSRALSGENLRYFFARWRGNGVPEFTEIILSFEPER